MKFFWVVLLLASFFYNSVCFSYEGIIVPLGDKKINTLYTVNTMISMKHTYNIIQSLNLLEC